MYRYLPQVDVSYVGHDVRLCSEEVSTALPCAFVDLKMVKKIEVRFCAPMDGCS